MKPIPLMSVAQCRWLDQAGAEACGISSAALMERAGRSAAQFVMQRWPNAQRFLVVCGVGNNGGDGYVCARYLQLAQRDVTLLATGPAKTPDASINAERWKQIGVVLDANDGQALRLAAPESVAAEYDVVIDALFGIGLSGPPRPPEQALLQAMNRLPGAKLALDVPSGLHADTGARLGDIAFVADVTLSFIANKRGLHTAQARAHVGVLQVESLGISESLLQQAHTDVFLLDASHRSLPARAASSHKGSHGHVLVVGGSRGFGGAALLCSEASICAGASLTSVMSDESHLTALLQRCPEAMWVDPNNADALQTALARVDVLAIGPGLGQGASAATALDTALDRALGLRTPCVFDADALNMLAHRPGLALSECCVMTPHPGEAARLLGVSTAAIEADRYTAVAALVQRFRCIVVLKGAGTLIAAPGQSTYVCGLGNAGMAAGGMGDVLTGCIAALLAQAPAMNIDLFQATLQAVLAHSWAADEQAHGAERGLRASDVARALRFAVNVS